MTAVIRDGKIWFDNTPRAEIGDCPLCDDDGPSGLLDSPVLFHDGTNIALCERCAAIAAVVAAEGEPYNAVALQTTIRDFYGEPGADLGHGEAAIRALYDVAKAEERATRRTRVDHNSKRKICPGCELRNYIDPAAGCGFEHEGLEFCEECGFAVAGLLEEGRPFALDVIKVVVATYGGEGYGVAYDRVLAARKKAKPKRTRRKSHPPTRIAE
jgi:hypothetical protein